MFGRVAGVVAALCLGSTDRTALAQTPEVRVEGRLVRDSFMLQSQPFPAWNVEVKYVNGSREPVDLGDTLVLVTPSSVKPTSIGVHVTRAPADASKGSKRVSDRYGLDWGIEVPSTGSALWPFGALSSQISQLNVLMFMLQTSGVDALPGGGYGPPLGPGEERTITDTVLFPFDHETKGERELVVVLPPVVRRPGSGTRVATGILLFDVKGIVEKGAAFTARTETLANDVAALRTVAGDASAPKWRRLLALNALAESHPNDAGDPLLRYASDTSVDPALRNSAILNLGLSKVPGALPPLLELLRTEPHGGPRVAAIASLGDLGDAAAAPAIRGFVKDTDEATSRFAIVALGSLKDSESVPLLAAVLTNQRQERLYAAAAAALVAIESDPAKTVVLSTLRDRRAKDRCREALISAVAEARPPWGITAVADIASNEQDEESVRVRSVWALRTVADGPSVAALQKAAASGKKKVREAAAAAVKQIEPVK